VYTVGVGTADGQVLGFEGWSFRARLDEEALKTIANISLGEYFYAGTATDLKKIYQSMNSRIFLEKKETEITALFAAGAAALAHRDEVLDVADLDHERLVHVAAPADDRRIAVHQLGDALQHGRWTKGATSPLQPPNPEDPELTGSG
jgi:hypothetical protein